MTAGWAHDWQGFFDAVRGQPPRETLLRALALFESEPAAEARLALDLGAGSGRDSLELLRRGWRVIAIDASAAGLDELSRAAEHAGLARNLDVRATNYEGMTLPQADLVNASFSIPHTAPKLFPALWSAVVGAVRPGGRFAGQLFGVHDSWNTRPDGVTRTYHTRGEVERMLAGLEVEYLDEVDRPGKNAHGEPKHWHVFHIVARKGMDPTEGSRA